jgi:phage anti-repressor protein
MLSQTKKAKEVRKYFIAMEQLLLVILKIELLPAVILFLNTVYI